MTNFEMLIKKQPERIKSLLEFYGFAIRKDGMLERCPEMDCKDCIFHNEFIFCKRSVRNWLDEGYEESEPTFGCDELVEVSYGNGSWFPRYYARYEEGKHYCWSDGKTSKTVKSEYDAMTWEHIRKCEQ